MYLLGRRDVADVPYCILACQVCLLPYRRDDFVESIDALKLYEYLACEKPIVATDMPTAREQSRVVYIAQDATDFVQKLETALEPITSEQRVLRRSIAMQNTWDQRVESLSAAIEERLGEHTGCQRDKVLGKGGAN